VPIFAADAGLGAGGAAGHTFGMAWIGHTLFGADNIAPWFKENADQCFTPQNGFVRSGPVAVAGTEVLDARAKSTHPGALICRICSNNKGRRAAPLIKATRF
jgi:hypothetical protein